MSTKYMETETFKSIGSLLINQDYIYEKIKCRFKVEKSCYH